MILTLPLFLLLTKASIRSAAFFLDAEKTDCCILPLFLSISLAPFKDCLLRNRRCIGMSLYKGEVEKMLASVRAFVV